MFYHCSFRFSLVLSAVSPAGILSVSVIFPMVLSMASDLRISIEGPSMKVEWAQPLPLFRKSRSRARTISSVHPSSLSSKIRPIQLFWWLSVAGAIVEARHVIAGLELQCNQPHVPWSHVCIPLLHAAEWGVTGIYSDGRGLKVLACLWCKTYFSRCLQRLVEGYCSEVLFGFRLWRRSSLPA